MVKVHMLIIDWNKFNEVGVKPENLSPEDIANIKNGKKTGMLNFSIEDTPGNRTLLDNEKVSFIKQKMEKLL